MQVGLGIAREVEVDHNIHCLNVNSTSQQIGADQIATVALTEVVEDTIAMLLSHLRVNVVTGVADFGDLLRQQFHTLSRVAEDDGLVDLELAEQRVQTVNFLLLVNEGVELSDSQQSELFHQVDLVPISE